MCAYTTEVIDWPNKPCIAIIAWSCLGRDVTTCRVSSGQMRLCDKRQPFLVRSRLLNLLLVLPLGGLVGSCGRELVDGMDGHDTTSARSYNVLIWLRIRLRRVAVVDGPWIWEECRCAGECCRAIQFLGRRGS